MDNSFSMSISTPCSQNFENFKKTNEGGYCSQCSKEVIDFRKYKDSEMLDFFTGDKGKVCGLFLENQLKNYSEYSSKNHSIEKKSFLKAVFSYSILSLLTPNIGFSQITKKESIEYDVKNDTTDKSKVTNTNQEISSGYVYDEIGPLPGANVFLKKYNLQASTGFDGKFTFNKKLNLGDILVVSFIGVKTKEYKISNDSLIRIDLKTYEKGFALMGEVEVKKIYKSKRTFWQTIKQIFNE